MGSKDDGLVRFFVAANFADYVFLLDGSADLIGQIEMDANFAGIGGDRSSQAQGVFAREDSLGNLVDLPIDRVGGAIEQQAFAGTHPENRGGPIPDSPRDDRQRLGPLVSEIFVGNDGVVMDEQDGALYASGHLREVGFGAVAHINDGGFDPARRCGRGPGFRNPSKAKSHRAEQFDSGIAFAPSVGDRVFFRVDFDAFGAKRGYSPGDGDRKRVV